MPEQSDLPVTADKLGAEISVGARVQVLEIDLLSFAELSAEERQDIQSMVGEVLAVYEVDPWGRPWVEKVWARPGGRSESHSIALEPAQMLLVRENGA